MIVPMALASVLTIVMTMVACSPNPTTSPATEENPPAYQLEADLLGGTSRFPANSQGKLLSKLEASSADGEVSLTIVKGGVVLDKDGEPLQTIQATIDSTPPPPPEDAHAVSPVYRLEPEGATFEPWLTVTLGYEPDNLPEEARENELQIAYHDGTEWSVPSYRKVDTDAHLVTTQIYHFASLAILAPKEPPLTVGTKTGNLAPDFQFQNAGGQTVSLNDMRGSPVVLNFWATWCGPCVYEMPLIQQMYEDYSEEGLVVLAINSGESPAKVEQFLKGRGLSFPVLLDIGQKITARYRIQYYPTTFFIDKDGIIRYVKPGAFLNMQQIEGSLDKIMP